MPILSPPASLHAPPPSSIALPLFFSLPTSRFSFCTFHCEANQTSSSPVNLGCPFLPSLLSPSGRSRRHRLGAARGPPESGPPPENGSRGLRSIAASLSRIQDSVQIFFAVLFWMSLFFWASAWDKRNRPSKGSRTRR